jgi:hypothetical protein
VSRDQRNKRLRDSLAGSTSAKELAKATAASRFAEDQIRFQGLEYDEETGKMKLKPKKRRLTSPPGALERPPFRARTPQTLPARGAHTPSSLNPQRAADLEH